MNEIELNKEFFKFKEIFELIIETEYNLDTFDVNSTYVLNSLEKLKFACLKYGIFNYDELENLSNLDQNQLVMFCDELKNKNKTLFADFIKNNL